MTSEMYVFITLYLILAFTMSFAYVFEVRPRNIKREGQTGMRALIDIVGVGLLWPFVLLYVARRPAYAFGKWLVTEK